MKKEKLLRIKRQLGSIESDLGISDLENSANDNGEDIRLSIGKKLKKIKNKIKVSKKDEAFQLEINKKLRNVAKNFIKAME